MWKDCWKEETKSCKQQKTGIAPKSLISSPSAVSSDEDRHVAVKSVEWSMLMTMRLEERSGWVVMIVRDGITTIVWD